MKKERMTILKMVSEGKITVDEAVKLIDSIKSSKTIDAGDVFETVKEKVTDFVEEAKPVVKKCATKAKEMGEDVCNMGKAKVEKYKAKAKDSDIIDEVIIEPVNDVKEAAKDAVQDIKESIDDTISDSKDAVDYLKETTKEAFTDAKEALKAETTDKNNPEV